MSELTKQSRVHSVFTTSKNVWVSENFKSIILEKYIPTEGNYRQDESIKASDLQSISSKIELQELVFKDADLFLEYVALLIENQIHGAEGKLLNDSSANYFFLKGKDEKYYSILVRWEQAQKLWRCGAYLQEELRLPNIRIFYPLIQV